MGTNCAPLIADLFLYCYERNFMSNLKKSKQFELMDRFNDISRYLDGIFTIENPAFAEHIPDIYPRERQLNKANTSDKNIFLLFKASAHSFKQFTSRLLKSTFSLSLCTYITRMDVMLDFICMGPVDLPGARRKRQNTKWKIPCPQWDSNPQPFDSKSDALPTELAGLGEC